MTPVGYKIKKLMKEGYPHKQAIAIALKMNEKGCLGPRGGKVCFGKKQFLFNPKNPKDTYSDTLKTIRKLERLYKSGKYSHKRIKQVAMILMVRLRVLKKKKTITILVKLVIIVIIAVPKDNIVISNKAWIARASSSSSESS